jgi:hypothetical protein
MDKAEAFAPALFSARLRHWLEVEFCADLDSARFVCAGNLPKIGIRYPGVDTTEVRVVEGVEVLAAQLESDALAHIQILDRSQIPVINPGAKQWIRPLAAKMSRSRGKR